ncbi:LysM peptidoglycan-binding domain-containing protein [bacterium]|nr:LysM peptidoglycan-binding domain-containing protein [bacterium]
MTPSARRPAPGTPSGRPCGEGRVRPGRWAGRRCPRLLVLPWFLLAALAGPALAEPRVSGIRHWTAPDHTRVVLDLEGAFEYRVTSRPSPERIVIDLPGASFACGTENRPVGDGLIGRIRCNRVARGVQVVLDLQGSFRFKYFALDAIPGEKPRRLVVDLFPTRRGEAQPAPEAPRPSLPAPPPALAAKPPAADTLASAPPASGGALAEAPAAADSAAAPLALAEPAPPASDPAPQPGEARALAEAPAERLITVVIDAGHGGEDPGAIYKGQREKDITLDIARRLARLLEGLPGYQPALTRSGDYYISLARRRELADEAQGDLLLSIHCNTAPNRGAAGIELYTLSTEGASSRRAQALADLENRADLVGGIYPGAGDEEYRLVISKQLKAAIQRSVLVAESLQKEARRDPQLKANRRLKRAGFAVCKMVSMPSVLVEVGFFTHGPDFALLTSPAGRQAYAEWLARGVENYFREHRSTLFDPLFARREKTIYKVKPGDSLSAIAKRFGVQVDDLVRVNKLKRPDRVLAGEMLLVMSDAPTPVRHRVRPGENLTLIAKRYGVTVDSLRQANQLPRDGHIQPGQELVILPAGGRRGG